MGHVTEAFTRLALANPHVRFTLRHNERTVYDVPADQDIPSRIGLFFGDDLARDLIEIQSGYGDVRLSGYVARPNQSRSLPRMKCLFLNRPFIRDCSLQHALTDASRVLLSTVPYRLWPLSCWPHLRLVWPGSFPAA